jgi:hypothetical protein
MAQQIDRAVSEEFLLEADAKRLHAQTDQSTLGR